MHTKVNQWTSNVVEGCLKRLAGLQKPFKYVVTCNFVQKAGAGMHTASTALWDGKVDGKHTVQWENQTIQCDRDGVLARHLKPRKGTTRGERRRVRRVRDATRA
jgi:hypothetical protein